MIRHRQCQNNERDSVIFKIKKESKGELGQEKFQSKYSHSETRIGSRREKREKIQKRVRRYKYTVILTPLRIFF